MKHELDLSGLNCPLPVLKTKKFLSTVAHGDVVAVITTDPASQADIADFCVKTGNILLKQDHQDKKIISTIQRKNNTN